MNKISLKDIAESLGVSKALVSLVLNDKGDERGINTQTQQRVRDKAKDLNYTPNQYARGLRTGKSDTIGLIIPDVSNVFYGKLCKTIEMKAYELGYNLIMSNTYEDPKKELELINNLLSKNIDGLIIASSQESSEMLKELTIKNFPLVLIDRVFDGFNVDSVSVSNIDGAKQAVKHLKNEGYKKIACLTISPVYISSISDRIKGYIEELNDAENTFILQIPHNDIDSGIESALVQIKEKNIDAVFCVNNNLTKSLLKKINKKNIETNYKIISFDDVEIFDFANPKVSAVNQPVIKIGDKSVGLLINQISKKINHVPQKIVLETELIIR